MLENPISPFTAASRNSVRSMLKSGIVDPVARRVQQYVGGGGPLVVARSVQVHGGFDEGLQGLLVDLVALEKIDGTPTYYPRDSS